LSIEFIVGATCFPSRDGKGFHAAAVVSGSDTYVFTAEVFPTEVGARAYARGFLEAMAYEHISGSLLRYNWIERSNWQTMEDALDV
jgi:hypothetical protein